MVLNRGLKFAPPDITVPKKDLIVDIETAIRYASNGEKERVRRSVIPVINNSNGRKGNYSNIDHTRIIKSLKTKDCYYMKADKSNNVVILNKSDYNDRMMKVITEGNYVEVKNPVPRMVRETSQALNKYTNELGWAIQRKLMVPNPKCPKLYGLPKTHKPGNNMRPIVSNINSPSEKLAKWLATEFRNLTPPSNMAVKNSFNLVEKIKDTFLEDDEVLCSFDVVALFPSVPLNDTFEFLERWLSEQDISDKRRMSLVELTRLCMSHNYFTFRKKFYKQVDGTAMGCALAPFLSSDIFMGFLETQCREKAWFPRIWLRYVDDILAVVKRDKVSSILHELNSLFSSIKFTCEVEESGTLPFLDILIKRVNGQLNFSIYRKPTSTQRFITSDSNHSYQHKMAAFNSMIHRMLNIPMTDGDYKTELNYIKDTALVNGFNTRIIDTLIHKHNQRNWIHGITTLKGGSDGCEFKRIPIIYHSAITGKLKNIFKKMGKQVVPVTRDRLGTHLCRTKDGEDPLEKSGIYSLKCSTCNLLYIGQSSRAVKVRWREHNRHIAKNECSRSSVAHHILNNLNHEVHIDDFKLIKAEPNKLKLDAWESLFMHVYSDRLMNSGEAPIERGLFHLLNRVS